MGEKPERVLAEAGVPFIETYEYQPALERARKAVRRSLIAEAEKAKKEAEKLPEKVREVVKEEVVERVSKTIAEARRLAVTYASAEMGVEEAREKLRERYGKTLKETLETIYESLVSQIEKSYNNAISLIDRVYNEYKAQGVETVELDGKKLSLDEWRSLAVSEAEKTKKQYLEEIEKWRRETLETIEKGEIEELIIPDFLSQAIKRLSKELSVLVQDYISRLEEWAKKERERVLKQVESWFAEQAKELEKVTREDQAKELVDTIYRYIVDELLGTGLFTRKEAEEIASRYRERAQEIAMKAVERAGAIEKFYNESNKVIQDYLDRLSKLVAEMGFAGIHQLDRYMTEVNKIYEEGLKKLEELAGRYRVPAHHLDKVLEHYKREAQRLREASRRSGEFSRKAHELVEDHISKLYSFIRTNLEGLASGRTPTEALKEIIKQLNLIDVKIKELGRQMGVDSETIETVVEHYKKQVDRHLKLATSILTSLPAYRATLSRYTEEASRNPVHVARNIETYKERLRKELEKTLGNIPDKDIRDALVQQALHLFTSRLGERLKQVEERAYETPVVCLKEKNMLYCVTWPGTPGQVGEVKISARNIDEVQQILLSMGLKPRQGKILVAGSKKEYETLLDQVYREFAPHIYMRRLKERALKGEKEAGLFEEARQVAEFVTEFYRVPAEELEKKATEEKGVKKALGLVGAGLAGLGAGAIYGALTVWDIPGYVASTYAIARNPKLLLSYVKGSPVTRTAELVGTAIGFGATYGKLRAKAPKAVSRLAQATAEKIRGEPRVAERVGRVAEKGVRAGFKAVDLAIYGALIAGLSATTMEALEGRKPGKDLPLVLPLLMVETLARKKKKKQRLELEEKPREVKVEEPKIELEITPEMVEKAMREIKKTGWARKAVPAEILVALERYKLLRKYLGKPKIRPDGKVEFTRVVERRGPEGDIILETRKTVLTKEQARVVAELLHFMEKAKQLLEDLKKLERNWDRLTQEQKEIALMKIREQLYVLREWARVLREELKQLPPEQVGTQLDVLESVILELRRSKQKLKAKGIEIREYREPEKPRKLDTATVYLLYESLPREAFIRMMEKAGLVDHPLVRRLLSKTKTKITEPGRLKALEEALREQGLRQGIIDLVIKTLREAKPEELAYSLATISRQLTEEEKRKLLPVFITIISPDIEVVKKPQIEDELAKILALKPIIETPKPGIGTTKEIRIVGEPKPTIKEPSIEKPTIPPPKPTPPVVEPSAITIKELDVSITEKPEPGKNGETPVYIITTTEPPTPPPETPPGRPKTLGPPPAPPFLPFLPFLGEVSNPEELLEMLFRIRGERYVFA